jgi:hypothetical protein
MQLPLVPHSTTVKIHMKHFAKILSIIFTTLFFAQAHAQSIVVKGKLLDKDSSFMLADVAVKLVAATDSTQANAVQAKSATDGSFSITVANLGKYYMAFSAPGYPTGTVTIEVPAAGINLGEIRLPKTAAPAKQGPPYKISGVIIDGDSSTVLATASVKLAPSWDTTNAVIILADSGGNFGFSVPDTGRYILSLSYTGYDNGVRYVRIGDSDADLGEIMMFRKLDKSLGNVTVIGRTPPARQRGDTTELNAAAFKVNPDATLEDLIKKAPGITIENGVITAQGEQVQKVTIDGRQFFGDDATAALKNLPADIVDKIQVFDRMSDQSQLTGFDDGNAVKSINIVTKADMRKGQFGRVYAGYGTDERYAAGGSVNVFTGNKRINFVGLFNNVNQQNFGAEDLLGVSGQANQNRGGGGGGRGGGGGGRPGGQGGGGNNFQVGQSPGIAKTNAIGVNFSDIWGTKKNMEFSGSYFFNNSNTSASTSRNRETFMPKGDTSRFTKSLTESFTKNINHRLNARWEYKIDSNNTLIIAPNISFQQNNSNSFTDGITTGAKGGLITDQLNRNIRESEGYNLSSQITYRHGFSKKGRSISINLNGGANRRDNNTLVDGSLSSFTNDILTFDTTRQQTDNLTNGYNISTNIAYTEPIGRKGQLQLNYNPQYTKNKADQQTLRYDVIKGNYSIFDTSQSNLFDNTVKAQNAGISYRVGDQNEQFSIGTNFQNTNLESEQTFPVARQIDKTYNNLLPNLQYNKRFTNKANFRINYRTSVNTPNINQLQNVVNKTNPLYISTGNADLGQSYTHTLFNRFNFTNATKGTSFFANVFVQKVNNYVTTANFLPLTDSILPSGDTVLRGAQLSKPINMDGFWSARAFFTYGVPIKSLKTNVNLNAGFNYTRLPGQTDYVTNISNSYTYNLGLTLASNISEYVDFNLSYNANFNNITNKISPSRNNKYYYHTVGARINLLTKSGWFILNDLTNQFYSGLADGFNQDFWLWNVSAGKKFLKDNRGELKLSVFDLLKQNQSITRTNTESYIEDVQTDVLRQYFMLTFTYTLKNFGKASAAASNERRGDRGTREF